MRKIILTFGKVRSWSEEEQRHFTGWHTSIRAEPPIMPRDSGQAIVGLAVAMAAIGIICYIMA